MKSVLALVSALGLVTVALAQEQVIDLSGNWKLAIDRGDVGEQQGWFAAALPGNDTIQFPGSMQAQGLGDDPGTDTPWIGDVRQDELDAGIAVKELRFNKPATSRFIKFEVLKGHGGFASIAELDIL